MAYQLKRKEGIRKSVCRIGGKSVAKALKHLDSPGLKSIHSTRKEIKKLRGLLRLVRYDAGKKPVEHIFQILREAAACLAAPRDAQIKAQALEDLAPRQAKNAQTLGMTRRELQRGCAGALSRFQKKNRAKDVRQLLREVPERLEKLRFEKKGWSAIEKSVRKTYRAAQQARDEARAGRRADCFHQWRKRVKDLLYYTQLLAPIWPEQMCALAAELDDVGEWLGHDHDLHVLRQDVVKRSSQAELRNETAELLRLINERQAELRASALNLGERLFEEKASDFSDRLHCYWKRWKSKRKVPEKNAWAASRGLERNRFNRRTHGLLLSGDE